MVVIVVIIVLSRDAYVVVIYNHSLKTLEYFCPLYHYIANKASIRNEK